MIQVFNIFIILLFTFFTNCKTSNSIREYKSINNNESSVNPSKIALVGFYPFYVSGSNSYHKRSTNGKSYNVTTYSTSLDYTNSLKPLFKMGKDISEFPVTGIREDVKESVVSSFFWEYRSPVGDTSADEMNKLIDSKRLKKIDADYYVVAIFKPKMANNTLRGSFIGILTGFPFILTLGTLPLYAEYKSESTFFLYDKDLSKIQELKYENTYWALTSWWTSGISTLVALQGNVPPSVYHPDIEQAQDELLPFLTKNTMP
jgi:hypothetical protein